ncbi:MAG: hypothetical protein OER88_08690, partial [Planctomycetota bacterium]|nr:hypothetical protein [Planctomycetota bacterium]
MSEFDTARNILHARIVYWGPAGCGKTTSVNTLRRLIDPEGRHRMYSVAMPDGRTHSFDLLPVEEFRFGRFRVRVRVIAAPGDAAAPDVRHALVRRADAIVFVADSRPDRVEANRASLAELEDALRSNGIDPASMPVVWTCNFQDAPAGASASDVCAALGIGAQMFESVATEGHGVLEAFADAFRYCTSAIAARHKIKDVDPNGVMPTQVLPQLVRGATRHASDKSGPLVITVPDALPAAARSAFAQLRLVEAHIETDLLRQQLVGRNAELMAINRVARSILSAMEADNLLVVLLDSTAEYLGADHASCVFFDPTNHGQLRTHVLGFGRDPILGLAAEPAQRFFEFLQNSDGPVPADPKRNPDLLHELQRVDRRVKRAMIQPIKGGRGKPAGWIAIYATADESPMSTQEVLFLSSISRLAALGVEQISMLDKVQNFSQRLEEEAHRRTGELEMANAKIRALNRGLESRVTERTRALEEANRHLRETRASAIYAARQSGMAQLGASFAHEVNNPVAGLTGNLH